MVRCGKVWFRSASVGLLVLLKWRPVLLAGRAGRYAVVAVAVRVAGRLPRVGVCVLTRGIWLCRRVCRTISDQPYARGRA